MDLMLGRETHDLQLVNYDLALNVGLPLVEQRLKQSLWFFLGEWYLDITDGIPYYEEILVKSPVQVTVESILKKAILETPNVRELIKFDMTYDNPSRSLDLAFTVLTDFGTLELSEVLLWQV